MLNRYGALGFLKILCSYLYTRLVHPHARLIRLPIDIRNIKHISFKKNLTTGVGCRIEAYPQNSKNNKVLFFGNNIEINDFVHIAAAEKVQIMDNVLIASKVFITDLNHGNYKGINVTDPKTIPKNRKIYTSPVLINKNVWIGENVCIMPGVTIGEGSIIGALSVVTKNIPEYSIAVGSPAKVIKKYDFKSKKWLII